MSDQGIIFNSQARVSYNDVLIDNIISSKVSMKPVYNTQKTAVKYHAYTIQIEAIVRPESFTATSTGKVTTDGAMQIIRQKLLEDRGTLEYRDKGLGEDFRITSNERNGNNEVSFGPKPLNLEFEILGGNKSARINWTVEVHTLKSCFNGSTKILEFWSTSSIKINRYGYQTLTRKGYLETANNVSGETLIENNRASRKFKDVIATLTDNESMEGYHLEHDLNFSPDDRILNFSLVYTEIETPNAYPLGVVSIDCDHSIGSNLLSNNPLQGSGFRSWKNSMACTISLRPRIPQLRAWEIFSAIASDRLNQSVSVDTETIDGELRVTRVRVPIILSLQIKESLFAHSMTFSITWVSYTGTISDIFNRSGVFKPYVNPDETWNDWVVDMRNNAQNTSGSYELTSAGITNEVVDNCSSQLQPNVPDTVRGEITVQVPAIFEPKCPPEESSWLDYQSKREIESSANKAVHKRFKDETEITRSNNLGTGMDPSTSVSEQFDTSSNEIDHFIQDFGNDKHMGVIKGYAIRIGRPTEPPRVTRIGGRPVVLQKDKSKISNILLSSDSTCPVHLTQWSLKYEILGHPNGNIESTVESSGGSANFQ